MPKRTIAVLNQKGGVGKTTTAINLSAYIAKLGKNVLLVDFDPQGNATSGVGINKNNLELSTYDVLFDNQQLAQTIKETTTNHLFLLPSNASLASAEVELVNVEKRETKLRVALDPVQYDFVIIDCPPALGLLTINALAAADYVLIPVQAEYYALEGLSQLLSVVQRIHETVNHHIELLGVILTMFDKRTTLSEQVLNELQKHFGNKLLATIVPRNIRLAEAPSYGQTIFEHDKWSKGARAYKLLAKEVLKRLST